MTDILARLANSSQNEGSHELQCRCFDAAEEISRLRMEAEASKSVIQKWASERAGMVAEIERLRRLATCGCGDGFTEHDPGTCGNCLAGMQAGVKLAVIP